MGDSDFDARLERFEECLAREDLAAARSCMRALAQSADPDRVELAYAEARLVWLEHGADAASPLLARVIELEPRHADAHHDLACLAEERGERERMIEHFLRVRALDARWDREDGVGVGAQFDHIESVARGVLDNLPEMFAKRLGHVPVLIERRPSRALVEDGFDPRAFGLFEGPTDAERDAPLPTRIVLFACNLLASFPEEPELSEQIETTLLHEIGHFFGLDEDQLEELGLG
jgi:predicted Zn-dependent protease with MMP-like domain